MSQIRTWLRRSGSCLCILCSSEDGSLKPWLLHLCSSVLLPNPHIPGGAKLCRAPRSLGGGAELCRAPRSLGGGAELCRAPRSLEGGAELCRVPRSLEGGAKLCRAPTSLGGGSAVQGALVPAHRGVPLLSVILASPSSHIPASSDRPSASSPFPVRHRQGGVPQRTVRAGRECQITS